MPLEYTVVVDTTQSNLDKLMSDLLKIPERSPSRELQSATANEGAASFVVEEPAAIVSAAEASVT